tara:strand:+ start:444 stop:677 length:234 start_codon:yes stop_codon:yes gene_type:complete
MTLNERIEQKMLDSVMDENERLKSYIRSIAVIVDYECPRKELEHWVTDMIHLKYYNPDNYHTPQDIIFEAISRRVNE